MFRFKNMCFDYFVLSWLDFITMHDNVLLIIEEDLIFHSIFRKSQAESLMMTKRRPSQQIRHQLQSRNKLLRIQKMWDPSCKSPISRLPPP